MFALDVWRPRHSLFPRYRRRPLSADGFFDFFFGDDISTRLVPAADVQELENAYAISLEMPGLDGEDIDVALKDGVLVVSGERKIEKNEDENGFVVRERSYGSYCRSFRLPNNVDQQNISAEYKDGILSLEIPKSEEEDSRHIEVKTAE